ncbi:MAG: hypothetical protein HUJ28_05020 [Chromatiales bacterium]|nr:hypothetical protein [Chromatiales bacterium]
MESLKESIQRQRQSLEGMLAEPLARIAASCAPIWGHREALDGVLSESLENVPYCTFLYALNTNGVQITDNVSRSGLLPEHFGRDRSQRPYMKEVVPATGFLLSDAYISLLGRRPSLTALQLVHRDDAVVGFIGADFDLRNLPVTAELYDEPTQWRQIKGDAAIRGTLFQQTRVESLMDQNIDQAMSILEELIAERGVFQCVLHFSSSRATVWTLDDPYRYRLLQHDALSDPDVCLAYPRRDYSPEALIPHDVIGGILTEMGKLRFADETVYLRSASINIFNGMISLTFSCDGSHYMSWDEFLEKNVSFWLGSAA